MEGLVFGQHHKDNNEQLLTYLNELSVESKQRFGPHTFSIEAIEQLSANDGFRLYDAVLKNSIIGYTIIKFGWLDFEITRLLSYGITETCNDITIAPSIADQYQGMGIGTGFLQYIIGDLSNEIKIENIYLWGGVQKSNIKAIKLYQKLGFKVLGEFEHNGMNLDMVLELHQGASL